MSSREQPVSRGFPELQRSGSSMPFQLTPETVTKTVQSSDAVEAELQKCLDSVPPLDLKSFVEEVKEPRVTRQLKLVIEQGPVEEENQEALLSSSYVRLCGGSTSKEHQLSQDLGSSVENNLNLSQPDRAVHMRNKSIPSYKEEELGVKKNNVKTGSFQSGGAASATSASKVGPPSCEQCGGCVGASGGVEEEGKAIGQRLLELRKSTLDWLSGRLDTMLGRSWMDLAELHGWNYQQTLDFKARCQAIHSSPFLALLLEPAFQTYTVDDLRHDLRRLPRKDILLELDGRLASTLM